jgi:response regulator RpfG family c-di-GMP phosphodiesterase
MAVGVQPPWLKVHKTVDLLLLLVLAQGIFRSWFHDASLIPGVAGNAFILVIFAVVAVELWSLQTRSRFYLAPALVPLIVLVGACASVWLMDASSFSWVLAATFLVFTRLAVRHATLVGGLAIVVSVGTMAWNWQLGVPFLLRAALSGAFVLVMLNLFFQVNEKILADLAQTRDHLDNALQNMSQGICVIGKDGHFKMFNDKACELLDLPRSLVERKPLLSEVVKFQSDRGDFGSELSSVEVSARSYVGTFGVDVDNSIPRHYLRQDRSGRYIEVHSQTAPSGDVVRTFSDVTKYEEVNRQLKVVLDEYQELSEQATQRGRDQMVVALTELSLIRDNETGLHTKRTQLYVRTLAQALVRAGHYTEQLSDQNIELIAKATPMHDLGKVGIPDHILLKPGRHTPEETQVMHTHAALGESILLVMAGKEQTDDSLFIVAAKLAGAHHENWDGSGYPRGLRGQDIPLGARLMALADVYDALTTVRAYKRAWTHEEASAYILSLRGTKFDPAAVDVFESEKEKFRTISMELVDH